MKEGEGVSLYKLRRRAYVQIENSKIRERERVREKRHKKGVLALVHTPQQLPLSSSMSLVSGDYDDEDDGDYDHSSSPSSSSSPSPPSSSLLSSSLNDDKQQDKTLKRRSTEPMAPIEPKKIKQPATNNERKGSSNNLFSAFNTNDNNSNDKADDDDELPPLPDSFASVNIPKISVTRSPPSLDLQKKKDNVDMTDKKKSFLVPPQIWKKQANVSTEDTRSWTTERMRKARKPPAVETM